MEGHILFWDLTLYFSGLVLRCPSCGEQGLFEQLHPICWKNGSRTYDQLRQLYGLGNDVLLVSRVYSVLPEKCFSLLHLMSEQE